MIDLMNSALPLSDSGVGGNAIEGFDGISPGEPNGTI